MAGNLNFFKSYKKNAFYPNHIQLTRSVAETSFVVAYVNVCGK